MYRLRRLRGLKTEQAFLSASSKKFADAIVTTLEGAGIEFTLEGGGVRLKAK